MTHKIKIALPPPERYQITCPQCGKQHQFEVTSHVTQWVHFCNCGALLTWYRNTPPTVETVE